jgi:hypothetical protein
VDRVRNHRQAAEQAHVFSWDAFRSTTSGNYADPHLKKTPPETVIP